RLAVINAAEANTFYRLYEQKGARWPQAKAAGMTVDQHRQRSVPEEGGATTVASAIDIRRPVNFPKALRSLAPCQGVVRDVTDPEILDGKARVGSGGLGCEPASAASVAGARRLRQEGVIAPDDRVVCILTGHVLKDPNVTVAYHSGERATYANRPLELP